MFTLLSTHVCFQSLSCVWLFATPWTVAYQAPLPMGFSRQEYWSGLSFPPPGELPNQGIEPMSPASPALQVNSLPLSHWGSPLSIQLCLLNTYLTAFNWHHPSEIKTPWKVGCPLGCCSPHCPLGHCSPHCPLGRCSPFTVLWGAVPLTLPWGAVPLTVPWSAVPLTVPWGVVPLTVPWGTVPPSLSWEPCSRGELCSGGECAQAGIRDGDWTQRQTGERASVGSIMRRMAGNDNSNSSHSLRAYSIPGSRFHPQTCPYVATACRSESKD